MSRRIERFEVTGPARVFLRLSAGEARIVPGDEGAVEVRLSGREAVLERFVVEDRAGRIVVEPETGRAGRWSRIDVEIRLGTGASIHARLASGDVTVGTEVGELVVESGSGDLDAGAVSGDAKVKTASGDIDIASVGGRLDVAAAAGDVRVGVVTRDVGVKTASGDISLGDVAGSLLVHSASGDIEVGRFCGDVFRARTLSGDVRVGLAPGMRLDVSLQSLSGEIRTEVPISEGRDSDATARLAIKTMSGDIVIRRAV